MRLRDPLRFSASAEERVTLMDFLSGETAKQFTGRPENIDGRLWDRIAWAHLALIHQ